MNIEEDKGEKKIKFYQLSENYWSKQPPTVNGMLGGFDFVSQADLDQSQNFLNSLKSVGFLIDVYLGLNCLSKSKKPGDTKLALDCGAGIGRITKNLLLNNFDRVEMVDVTEGFIAKAKEYLGEASNRVARFHVCALQNFCPEPNTYDCIWMQWVLGKHSYFGLNFHGKIRV